MKYTNGQIERKTFEGSNQVMIGNDQKRIICMQYSENEHIFPSEQSKEEAEDNAALIVDAFNTTTACGYTPSELLEQRNQMVDILKTISVVLSLNSGQKVITDHLQNEISDLIKSIKSSDQINLEKAKELYPVGTKFVSLFGVEDIVNVCPNPSKSDYYIGENSTIMVYGKYHPRVIYDNGQWAQKITRNEH